MKTKIGYLILLAGAFLLFMVSSTTLVSSDDGKPAAVSNAAASNLITGNYTPTAEVANCRYGATLEEGVSGISTLDLGWFLNFTANTSVMPSNNAEFAHVIRVRQDKTPSGLYLPTFTTSPPLTDAGLGDLVEANPGALWLVGNEPDRGPDPGSTVSIQDDTFPDVYAEAYHDTYHFIKQIDPTAQVAIAGLVQVTPGRLQYLDIVWDSYIGKYGTTIPVDVWNMHIYILAEADKNGNANGIASIALGTDPTLAKRSAATPSECSQDNVYCIAEHDDIGIFMDQVVAMRTWMKEHGQQNKPLILSEFSSLFSPTYPSGTPFLDEFGQQFTIDRINDFMDASVSYLKTAADPSLGYPLDNNRLVQQWMWFSMFSTSIGWGSNLLEDDFTTLSQLGLSYQDFIDTNSYNKNLLVGRVSSSIGPIVSAEADVQLSAEIRNNGTQMVTGPITVRFYKDAALTQPIGSAVTIPDGLRGCARSRATVSTTWANLGLGFYNFWVRVTPVAGETNLSDNVGTGTFLIDDTPVVMPVVLRK
ncbi:MAG: hypothetical protein M9918_00895 [Anaerolineae bacterium]|nr:hypothetical protein [Anaerolineae bacterium]